MNNNKKLLDDMAGKWSSIFNQDNSQVYDPDRIYQNYYKSWFYNNASIAIPKFDASIPYAVVNWNAKSPAEWADYAHTHPTPGIDLKVTRPDDDYVPDREKHPGFVYNPEGNALIDSLPLGSNEKHYAASVPGFDYSFALNMAEDFIGKYGKNKLFTDENSLSDYYKYMNQQIVTRSVYDKSILPTDVFTESFKKKIDDMKKKKDDTRNKNQPDMKPDPLNGADIFIPGYETEPGQTIDN